ncbi:MAG TPA: VWA domain-containing protein [Thermoanaerobaculia bacterium]
MDVVFVVDNTGSMGNVIAEVQAQVNSIADTVAVSSGGDYQFGLVTAPANNVNVLLDLAPNNHAALTAAVTKMTTEGSCGEPAEWDEALNTVLNNLQKDRSIASGAGAQIGNFNGRFRPNATKIIIVITDARPGGVTGCDFGPGDRALTLAMADNAASRNILIPTVFVPTESAVAFGFTDTVRNVLSDVAGTTDSLFMATKPDASDLASIIREVIISCGSGRLRVEPTELVLDIGQTGSVNVTNFRPGADLNDLTYRAFGLPGDSTYTFTRIAPQIADTDLQKLDITIGPETPTGTYVVPIAARRNATGRTSVDYVLVYVGCLPPIILGAPGHQPESQSVPAGMRATLKVAPEGSGGFRYQWYRGYRGMTFSPIEGATGPTYTTPVVTGQESYWVRVTNACGSVDSLTAVVSPQ